MRPAAAALAAGLAFPAAAAPPALPARLASALGPLSEAAPGLEELYLDLHRTPELSHQETATAAKLAARLRALGYEVTEKVGGTGVVGVLANGDGPVVMLRTDLDALPVEEKTGLPHASRASRQGRRGPADPGDARLRARPPHDGLDRRGDAPGPGEGELARDARRRRASPPRRRGRGPRRC